MGVGEFWCFQDVPAVGHQDGVLDWVQVFEACSALLRSLAVLFGVRTVPLS